MRTAVVGAGIVGASAALELCIRGHDVTLFEQFEIDHDRGSSYGDSRIIRMFYDDPYYTKLMPDAFAMWQRLETMAGETLYERLGGLYFAPSGHASIASAVHGMQAVGMRVDVLDARALRARFPAFRFSDDEAGIVDDRAGSLRASRCVRAVVRAARDAGVTLRTRTVVRSIESANGVVALTPAGESIRQFDRVVVCAGPWSRALLQDAHLPVRATLQQYVYLRPTQDASAFEPGAMPIWIDAPANFYGFPRHGDVPGVKISSHDFGPEVNPDDVDRTIVDALVARTRDYARRRLPALANGDVTYAKTCLYTVSPDEDFIVDAVPDVPGCYFVTGCSGHAFKFGPLLGAIAADLARDREPRCDISRFRLRRFETASS